MKYFHVILIELNILGVNLLVLLLSVIIFHLSSFLVKNLIIQLFLNISQKFILKNSKFITMLICQLQLLNI